MHQLVRVGISGKRNGAPSEIQALLIPTLVAHAQHRKPPQVVRLVEPRFELFETWELAPSKIELKLKLARYPVEELQSGIRPPDLTLQVVRFSHGQRLLYPLDTLLN